VEHIPFVNISYRICFGLIDHWLWQFFNRGNWSRLLQHVCLLRLVGFMSNKHFVAHTIRWRLSKISAKSRTVSFTSIPTPIWLKWRRIGGGGCETFHGTENFELPQLPKVADLDHHWTNNNIGGCFIYLNK
jgi:hypothetical protein